MALKGFEINQKIVFKSCHYCFATGLDHIAFLELIDAKSYEDFDELRTHERVARIEHCGLDSAVACNDIKVNISQLQSL